MDSKQGQRIHIRGGSDVADKLIKAMEGTEVKVCLSFGKKKIIFVLDE